MNFVQQAIEKHGPMMGNVLELGSHDVNGSVRQFFSEKTNFPIYVGLDLLPGTGVDLRSPAAAIPFRDDSFGVVVSTEMLEHDPTFWLSLQEMRRVLRPNGHCIITTRNIGFKRHDYPSDYFRFTADGLRMAMRWAGFAILEAVDDLEDQGTFAAGKKCL